MKSYDKGSIGFYKLFQRNIYAYYRKFLLPFFIKLTYQLTCVFPIVYLIVTAVLNAETDSDSF